MSDTIADKLVQADASGVDLHLVADAVGVPYRTLQRLIGGDMPVGWAARALEALLQDERRMNRLRSRSRRTKRAPNKPPQVEVPPHPNGSGHTHHGGGQPQHTHTAHKGCVGSKGWRIRQGTSANHDQKTPSRKNQLLLGRENQ